MPDKKIASMEKHAKKIFLTHSSFDKEFVRFLDSSLVVAGANTFFDERDINIGDSIPETIYSGIEKANYLIYVISNKSVLSSWVQEELSVSKMRQLKQKELKILPVLIDEVEIPLSLSHIKYADFRDWKDPYSYRSAFLRLLMAIGIEPKLVGSAEVQWYLANVSEIKRVLSDNYSIVGEIFGALSGYRTGDGRLAPHYQRLIKLIVQNKDYETRNNVSRLRHLIPPGPRAGSLDKIKYACDNFEAFCAELFEGRFLSHVSVEEAERVRNLISNITTAIEEFRSNCDIVLFSQFRLDQANGAREIDGRTD